MKKLELRMEELAVESFATNAAEAERGTVQGQDFGPTVPSCPSINLCLTQDCVSGECPTSRTTLCRC